MRGHCAQTVPPEAGHGQARAMKPHCAGEAWRKRIPLLATGIEKGSGYGAPGRVGTELTRQA